MRHINRQILLWGIGPVLTILLTIGHDWLVEQGYSPVTVAPLMPFLVLAGFVNGSPRRPWLGLWAAMVGAAWLSIYSIYLGGPFQWERFFWVPISLFSIAILVGLLRAWAWQREAQEWRQGEQALSQNEARLEALENLAQELYQNWERMSEAERRERAGWIWDRANNIISLAEGWRQVGRHQYWARLGHKDDE